MRHETRKQQRPWLVAALLLGGLCLNAGAQAPLLPTRSGPLVPGPAGPPRLIYGIASVVDVRRGALQLAPPVGGLAAVSVTLTPQTQMVALQTARVSDLKIGDEISVRGMATELAVSSLTWNAVSPGEPSAPADVRPPGSPSRPPFAGLSGAASAAGRITSVQPLVIAFADGATLTLRAASNVRVTRIAPVPISHLKAGAALFAFGPMTGQSVLTADILGVGFTPADLQFASSF